MTKGIKICIHWTAGGLVPSNVDLEHYHFVVDSNGKVHKGSYTPEDNFYIPRGKTRYAKHCGGGNTKTIGIAVCGSGVAWHPPLMTQKGVEALLKKCAELCYEYDIPIQETRVYTHYEFGKKHPKTSSAGKIDIYKIPYEPQLDSEEVGEYLRKKIRWYFKKL